MRKRWPENLPRRKKKHQNQIDVMKSVFLSLAESLQQLRALVDVLPVR